MEAAITNDVFNIWEKNIKILKDQNSYLWDRVRELERENKKLKEFEKIAKAFINMVNEIVLQEVIEKWSPKGE